MRIVQIFGSAPSHSQSHFRSGCTVRETYVLSVLTYGSQAWSGQRNLIRRLEVFCNKCYRTICRISVVQMREKGIHMKDIRGWLGLKNIEYYTCRNAMRWLGHMSRMGDERIPKRMLYAWIPDRDRKKGGGNRTSFGKYALDTLLKMPQYMDNKDQTTMGAPPAWTRTEADGTAMQYNPFGKGAVADEWQACQNWVALASDRGAWKRACAAYLAQPQYQ